MGSQGTGVNTSVNKRKSKTERAARRKVAVSPMQATIEPTPTPPAPDAILPSNAPFPSPNGEDETALARLADDGAPPPPEAPTGETPVPPAPVPPTHKTGETPVVPPPEVPAQTHSLEERVRRLEEALALLQEQRAAETRTISPPSPARPPDPPPQAKLVPPPVGQASRLSEPPPSTAILLDVGKRLLGTAAQVAPPAPASVPSVAHSGRSGILWLLWDTWAEARAIVRMFVDPRYHLPWSARVLPLAVLAAILTSKYWIPGSSIPILGDWLLVKLIDLFLAFLLFKWLGHEARRYRQTSPDLPPNLRL